MEDDLSALAELSRRYRKVQAEADEARAALYDAIEDVSATDVTQRDVAEASGFTREFIRRLLLARKGKASKPAGSAGRRTAAGKA